MTLAITTNKQYRISQEIIMQSIDKAILIFKKMEEENEDSSKIL